MTYYPKTMFAAIICGAAIAGGAMALAPGAAAAPPAALQDSSPAVSKMTLVEKVYRRRVCWWRHGRRVCTWRRW